MRIRVGAALDANTTTVFRPLVEAARRARQQVQAEMNMAGAAMQGPYRTNARVATQAIESVGKTAKQQADAMVKDVERSARERVRLEKQAMREIERELKEHNRARERAERGHRGPPGGGYDGGGGGDGGRFGRRVGYWSMRNFAPVTPTLSIARRAAHDIARGAGVTFDTSSLVSNYVERERMATDIANSGYIKGGIGAAGVRQDPRALLAEANSVGAYAATDPSKALGGLESFVKVTGDLELGRLVLKDMAVLARATGSNLDHVVSAAGNVAKNIGDVGTHFRTAEEKAQAVEQVMRGIAAQGKLGSVEMSDLAVQMAKIAAAAGQIGGSNKAENILIMGALAQEARGTGGASSASIAATSTMSFVNTLKTPARMHAFKAEGINVLDEHQRLRDPRAVILESLSKTGGNVERMKTMFANIMGERAVTGFANIYRDAAGAVVGKNGGKATAREQDAAGLAAVNDEFKKLMAGMSKQEVMDSFGESMKTAEAKAQKFQNQLQEIADRAVVSLIPAMEKLAPRVLGVVDELSKFVNWAAAHPGLGIGAALAASIAKAGLENVLRAGVERLFGAGRSGGGSGGAGVGIAGGLGAAFTIAAAAVTIAEVGMLSIDKVADNAAKAQRRSIEEDLEATNLASQAKAEIRTGALGANTRAAVEAKIANLESRIEHGKNPMSMVDAFTGWVTAGADFSTRSREVADSERLDSIREELTKLQSVMFDIRRAEERRASSVTRVQVVNPPAVESTRVPFASSVGP